MYEPFPEIAGSELIVEVYIVTGLKIASGLKCTRQRTSGHEASMTAGGHVHQEVNIEGGVGTSSGSEQTGKI